MRWKFSIRQRIAFGLVLMALLVMIASVTGLVYGRIAGQTVKVIHQGELAIKLIADLQVDWLKINSTVDYISQTRLLSMGTQELTARLQQVDQHFAELEAIEWVQYPTDLSQSRTYVETLRDLHNQLETALAEFKEKAGSGQWDQADKIRFLKLFFLLGSYNEQTDLFQAYIHKQVDNSANALEQAESTVQTIMSLLVMAAVGMGILTIIITITEVKLPLDDLMDTVKAFRDGNFLARATPRIQNELGLLADVLNNMAERISLMVRGLEQEILERKRAEEALHNAFEILTASESKFRTLFEKSTDVIFLIDNGIIIDCNPATLIQFRAKAKDQVVGLSPADISPEYQQDGSTSAQRADRLLKDALEQGRQRFEWLHRRFNGEIFHADIEMTAIPMEQKRILHVVLRDITDRKRTELALQNRIVALTQPLELSSSVKFADLFDLEEIQKIQDSFAAATGVASVITLPDGTPLTRTSNFCKLCVAIRSTTKGQVNCRKSDAIIGRENSSGPIVQPCLSGGLWDAGASITVGGTHIANWLIGQVKNEDLDENEILNYAHEIGLDEGIFREALADVPVMSKERFQKISETLFLLTNKLSLIAYQNMQQSRFIYQRQQAEEALRQSEAHLRSINETLEQRVRERTAELIVAKDQAEAANRAKSMFLANMSHELRTPLNAILGYAQILQRMPLDPDILHDLNTIQLSGEHLLTLINDVLDFSKIEAGKVEIHAINFDLLEFFDVIAELIEVRAGLKNLSFRFELLGILPSWVQADSTRLRQVLLNLLGNAVKFTDKGSVTLRIRSLPPSRPDLCRLRFEVQDTGVGIEMDEMERLFQPFEQFGDLARQAQGTGLGLAISLHLVKLMGGDLVATSQPGSGSHFEFTLEMPVVEGTPHMEVPSKMRSRILGYAGVRRKILVVDDVDSNRYALIDMLKSLGFETLEARDGQQAIDQAKNYQPDLIFMDRWMEGIDGIEAARRIRQIPELKKNPIVAVSASVMDTDQIFSLESGFDAFLAKPIEWNKLEAILEEQLHIEWEYQPANHETNAKTELVNLTPPPIDELENLYELARMGDISNLYQRAVQLADSDVAYAAFAKKLQDLAMNYEEQALISLIQQYLPPGSDL